MFPHEPLHSLVVLVVLVGYMMTLTFRPMNRIRVTNLLLLHREVKNSSLCARVGGSQVPEWMRKVDRPTQQADSSKIVNPTGWSPRRSVRMVLQDALREVLA